MKHLLFILSIRLASLNYAQTKVIVPHPETGREMFYFSEGLYKDYEIIRNYGSDGIDKELKKGDKTVEILEGINEIQVSEYDSHTHIKYVFTYNKENFNSEGIFSENQISDEQLINSLNDAYYEKFGKRPIKLLRGSDGKKYCSMNFGTFFFTISSVTNFMPIEIARQESSSSRLKP